MNILVTAGPTREMIDPVRFISNLSTGHMGYEIARQARKRRHRVVLISGPTALPAPEGIRFIPVISVVDMERAVMREVRSADVLMMTAAVGDYTPMHRVAHKLKRSKGHISIRLRKTHDIIARVAALKKKPLLVGFSLETRQVRKSSLAKLRKKQLDFIVANGYSKRSMPFGKGKTSVLILSKTGGQKYIRYSTKAKIAQTILAVALNSKHL